MKNNDIVMPKPGEPVVNHVGGISTTFNISAGDEYSHHHTKDDAGRPLTVTTNVSELKRRLSGPK